MQQTERRPQFPATIGILIVNVVVFGIQYIAKTRFSDFPFMDYFALSLPGLKAGFIWQLLTYQFLHAGFLHIFLNCWAIFMFGRAVEFRLGKVRMLTLYFISGIGGGLLQMLGAIFWPDHFGIAVLGASAGAFGLVTAYTMLFPNQVLVLLLFFVIPIRMRAKTMLWWTIALAVVGIIIPYGDIGHAAHLGGIITGFLFARGYLQRPPASQY